jgi:hypothetical protein
MRHDPRHQVSLKQIEPLPLPPSLEQAFNEIEKPMVYFADATPETRATVPRTGDD